MDKIVKFIVAIVKFVVMPFHPWFLKNPSDTQDVSSSQPTVNDNSKYRTLLS